MISKLHLVATVLIGVLASSVVGAQVHSEASTAQPSSGHARPAARAARSGSKAASGFRSTPQPNVVQISPSGQIAPGFAPAANLISFDGNAGVPGLGFDFPHLAAISGGLGNNFHSHFGHHGFGGQGYFVPILYGGNPYYDEDLDYDRPEQQTAQQTQPQPQIIVIQQPAPAQQAAESGSDTGNPSASVPAPQTDEPVPDLGNFILVRRDGRVLFASVFSVVGSQLQYVTPEGIRRILAMSDLDADATRQMNEARGTTVQIHN